MAELCNQFELHANQITECWKQLLTHAADALEGGSKPAKIVDLVPPHGIEALAADQACEQAAGPGYKVLLASSISGRFALLGGDEFWVHNAKQAEKNCWKSN